MFAMIFGYGFLPTPSARRATRTTGSASSHNHDFYPRPPRGGRLNEAFNKWNSALNFYPRPPRGGRHIQHLQTDPQCIFLPTPSARRATYETLNASGLLSISTHALREEGDGLISIVFDLLSISTHALREEGDKLAYMSGLKNPDFYPRPPRGGRLDNWLSQSMTSTISTHALREEGDRFPPSGKH